MDNSYKPSSGGVEPDICPTAFSEEEGGKVTYIEVAEYAQIEGISVQAVRKRIHSGKVVAKKIDDPRQPNGKWMIAVETKSVETVETVETKSVETVETVETKSVETVETKSVETKSIATVATNPVATVETENVNNQGSIEGKVVKSQGSPVRAVATPPQPQKLTLPTGSVITSGTAQFSEKQERIALRRAQVCQELDSLIKREDCSIAAGIDIFLELYNNTAQNSVIYATLGEVSPSTLRRWHKMWKQDKDWRSLIPRWKSGNVGHEVPTEDFNWIIGLLHSDDKPSISSALRWWHLKLRTEGRAQPVSDRTMRRAIDVFAQKHAGRWTYMRKGAKYFREHHLPFVLQDGSNIRPGDLWYSDGCTLNFDVMNPYTQKPCRPTFVPFMDYASRMIVGFDLDFSENRRVISSAYRNAITLWGFVPLYVKWDNGKAFRSLQGTKLNRRELEELRQLERDEIAEISGNIYATGVLEILNSLPYNPTGKPQIERWFGTLDNGFERYMPGYRGNSIGNKPAHLMRNEKHLQALNEKRKGNDILTVTEAKILLQWWIIEVYGMEAHEGLGGRKPWEVWQEGIKQIDESRRRNPDELWYLMLTQEVKKLDRGGVKVRGLWYYDEALFDYVGRKVFVRYDQMDDRYVFVYDELNQPICRALLRDEHDPLVTVRGSADAKLQYQHEMQRIRRLEKRIKSDAEELQELTRDGGTFMQEAIHKVRNLKPTQQITNLGHAIPEMPSEPQSSVADASSKEGKQETEQDDESGYTLPPDYLAALGMERR